MFSEVEDACESLAELFRVLSDETRLQILALLSEGNEICVCHLVERLQLPQSTVSRQLAILRNFGLVSARREGKWVHYEYNVPETPFVREQIQTLLYMFSSGGADDD